MTATNPSTPTVKRKRGRPPLAPEQRAAKAALPLKRYNRRADHMTRPEVIAYADKPLTAGRLLSRFEVIARTGLSTSMIYRRLADGTFPCPVKLSTRKVMWQANDILSWLASPVVWTKRREIVAALEAKEAA